MHKSHSIRVNNKTKGERKMNVKDYKKEEEHMETALFTPNVKEKKEQLVAFFEDKYTPIKDMVLAATVWSDCPDRDLCNTMAEGLQSIANAGSKKAAALYCAATAYDNNEKAFSDDIAVDLLFTADAVEDYHILIKEVFYSIVDEDHYDYLYAYPTAQFFKKMKALDLNND